MKENITLYDFFFSTGKQSANNSNKEKCELHIATVCGLKLNKWEVNIKAKISHRKYESVYDSYKTHGHIAKYYLLNCFAPKESWVRIQIKMKIFVVSRTFQLSTLDWTYDSGNQKIYLITMLVDFFLPLVVTGHVYT